MAMLTAQWPLAAGDSPEKRLLAVENLREKIKTGDLAGLKDAEKLSPEEQELLEEASGEENQNQFYMIRTKSRLRRASRNSSLSPGWPRPSATRPWATPSGRGSSAPSSWPAPPACRWDRWWNWSPPTARSSSTTRRANNFPGYRSNDFMTMQRAWMQNNMVTGATDQSMEVMSGSPGPAVMHISVTAKFNLAPAKEGGK